MMGLFPSFPFLFLIFNYQKRGRQYSKMTISGNPDITESTCQAKKEFYLWLFLSLMMVK